MNVKFTFYLKSGKVFETVVEMTGKEFTNILNIIKTSFSNEGEGFITLRYCVIRLSECAVVDWEVLNE